MIRFRIQIFNTTDDYQFSTITTRIILWGFYPEDTDDQEMCETFIKHLLNVWHFDRVILCLLFWLPATNLYLPLDIFLMAKVCCKETCTLVLLQWIMHLFRDHALPNEHPSLLKMSANILWRSGKWHTLTNARCNSAHKKSQMDSSNKFLLLLSVSWLIYDTAADVSNFIKICPISSTPKGEFSDLPWVCAHLLQVVSKLKPKC